MTKKGPQVEPKQPEAPAEEIVEKLDALDDEPETLEPEVSLDEEIALVRGQLEDVLAERQQPPAESQTFAQYSLVLLDRMHRTMDELRDQLRFADETLLLSSLGGNVNPMRLSVINQHHQSIGIKFERVGSEITVMVTHRGQAGMIDVPRGQIYQEEV